MTHGPEHDGAPLRILVAEDMAIVRAGLRLLLESFPHLRVVGEAESGPQVLAALAEARPDLLLMDVEMPGMDGLEATRAVREAWPALPILILTVHEEQELFFRLLEAGANGYLVKGGDPADLEEAVRTVAGGGAYLYPTLARCLVDQVRAQGEAAPHPLSERELEVLRLTARGMTAVEIGEALFISKNTVARHRANIMAKLELSNRSQLIRYALERGLIPRRP